MIKFYYHPSRNPAKVALFLEEAGLDYEVVPLNAKRRAVQPEIPCDQSERQDPALTDGAAALFDSTAILLYLVQKTGRFMAGARAVPSRRHRGRCSRWHR